MSAYLKSLSLTPSFPPYTGPYKVGSIDVEIPVSALSSPSPAPVGAENIHTILFRIWYPCVDDAAETPINWLPKPQREHVAAYSRFLGAGNRLANFISFFPRILHYITIPVHKNALPLPSPNPDAKWPILIFSHGLGGNRNTYSHLCASLASHGIVILTPEHRDGSAPITYIRSPTSSSASTTIPYTRADHVPSPAVHALRTAQLRTRFWELGLLHDALVRIDAGAPPRNLNPSAPLDLFAGHLAVHEPGSVAFGGHSFGAATVAQFVKSVYYAPYHDAPDGFEALYDPAADSEIKKQVTPRTPLVLLDIWLLPLRAPSARWLWDQPLPCYAASGRGGRGVVTVSSEVFFKWRVHLKLTKRFLSASPGRSQGDLGGLDARQGPRFYWVERSAHLSQSDFGVLFPWVVRRIGGVEGERVVRLNGRAVREALREGGWMGGVGDGEIFGGEGVRGWHAVWLDVSELKDVGGEEEEETVEHGQGQSAVGGDGGSTGPAEVEGEEALGSGKL